MIHQYVNYCLKLERSTGRANGPQWQDKGCMSVSRKYRAHPVFNGIYHGYTRYLAHGEAGNALPVEQINRQIPANAPPVEQITG